MSVILRFSISSNSSIVGKYCWNSDTPGGLNGDAGVIFGESDVDDTGDGGPKLEAGISVCGVDTMGVNVGCIGVITEVWRDNRLKGFAGIGEIGDGDNVGGGKEDDDDTGWIVPLIPLVTSRGTCFEATDNPAFCKEAIRPAIDLCPEELCQRNPRQDGTIAQIPAHAYFEDDVAPELSSSFSLDSTWVVLLMIPCAWFYSSNTGHDFWATRSEAQ